MSQGINGSTKGVTSVPVPGPGTDVLGVSVVGRRLDGRVVRSVDLPFLEAKLSQP